MKNIEDNFVPYEIALELKKLGFDEPCLMYYDYSWTLVESGVYECKAPLYQQAFGFFREKYNLRGFIGFRPNTKQFDFHVYDMSLSGMEYVKQRTMQEFNKDPKVGTYEEAELECLKQLILITNETNKNK